MANPRLLVKRLKAIKNIRKITRTMELIATARFKKAMDRATEATAYTRKINEIVADLSRSSGDITHPLLVKPETTASAKLLTLNSNRGLCGGYNAAVLRVGMARLKGLRKDGVDVSLEVSGKRGISYMRFQGQEVDEKYTHFEDAPKFDEVEVIAERYMDLYTSGQIGLMWRTRSSSIPPGSKPSSQRCCLSAN